MKKVTVLMLLMMMVSLLQGGLVQGGSKVEMLEWEEARTHVPRYSTFTVMDTETGKKFKVQRRAGSRHADVQPLTSEDTKIMKEIYGGKWSWKRRSIVVFSNGKEIAASMHGMPHGAGALKNNFPGHFCIHFYGSTTHRSGNMDISHKLMVLKAAGKLEDYMNSSDPFELVNAYVAGLKQHDAKIASAASLQRHNWEKIFAKVENVKITKMEVLPFEDNGSPLDITVPVEIDWFLKTAGRVTYRGEIRLFRFSPYGTWKVDSKQFLKDNKLV